MTARPTDKLKNQYDAMKKRERERFCAAPCSALDAGSVAAGPTQYVVTHTHDHKTLRLGDIVVIGETPRMQNVLIRVSDMTVHGIVGEADQYVHLEPNAEESHGDSAKKL